MKILLIDLGAQQLSKENINDKHEWSEEWLIGVSKLLAKNNEVDVFCNTKEDFVYNNVNFKNIYYIITRFLEGRKYDIAILNRIVYRFDCDFIALCKQYRIANKVFLQMHDFRILCDQGVLSDEQLQMTLIRDSFLTKILYINDNHKQELEKIYPTLKDLNSDCLYNEEIDKIPHEEIIKKSVDYFLRLSDSN